MEIETKKVWDFSKENYVNRLIQNEIDGKMVEFNPPEELEDQEEHQISSFRRISSFGLKDLTIESASMFNKKVQAINHEYNTILV
jgi:hypothetical protein